ncbi:MAG: MATE family efflux transporter [Tannerellaceae bacterium]|nr:MATE family efflux transporter [Tannerellaceae bacterium]
MNFAVYKTHYKETIRLGVPIMLGQLGIIIVGFADNMMVGHHNDIELSAASFVNNFFNLAFIFGMGFSYGLTPIISSLYVSKDLKKAGETLKNSLLLNLLIGIILSLIMLILLYRIDIFDQPEQLLPYIKPYYILQLFSIIFTMLFNSFKQFSDGTTDTLTPMWVMLGGNVLNIIGNYILIYGHFGAPELGLTGAGISTLSSRILTFICFSLLFIQRRKYKEYLKGFKEGYLNRTSLSRLLNLGLPVGFQLGVESASFSLSVIMMGWLGAYQLAAHQIMGVITTLGFMVYYGIAAAVAIRVSSYYSQNDNKNVRRATFVGLHIIILVAFFVMLLVFLTRNYIGYLFTMNEEIIFIVALLAYPVIFYQVGDGLQILFANALRGISHVKFMAIMALICHVGIALPVGYICGFILDWGALGIWCGFPISLTVLGITLWLWFNKLTT